MIHALVRRKLRTAFETNLSQGDFHPLLRLVAPNVHHAFAGDHPLGGERHSRHAMNDWFERVFRLYPRLDFEVRQVLVSGWPWRLAAAVEWVARATPIVGEPYANEGTHVLNIHWGRIVYLHAYEDSQAVAHACRDMAARGIDEAAAAPITD